MKYFDIIKKYGIKYFIISARAKIKKAFFVFVQKFLYKGKDQSTYSQYSEDLYIDRILGYLKDGVFIDVGANHPSFLSNTKKFYDRGWRGINIDPNTENFDLFNKDRSQDVNLNVGIGTKPGQIEFYRINPSTLSTFSAEVVNKLVQEGYEIIEKVNVPVITLTDVFEKHNLTHVNFISIDTEGNDLDVVMSNDWSKFKADLLCIEVGNDAIKIEEHLKTYGYNKVADNGLNVFFVGIRTR